MNVLVAAPGASLTESFVSRLLNSLHERPYVIAVSDGYQRVPYDAIVANDSAWWRERPEALAFNGPKYSTRRVEGVEQVPANELVSGGSSSGVLALWVARQIGAKRIAMVGFDHRGEHFFGPHTGQLKNTPQSRWPIFTQQFQRMFYQLRGDRIEVLNCTPDSALDVFPKASIEDGLEWLSPSRSAA